jgi:hypothetical protein
MAGDPRVAAVDIGQPTGGPPGIQDAPRGSNPAFIACARCTAGAPVGTSTGYFGQEFTGPATSSPPLRFTRSYAESIADPAGPDKALAVDGPFSWALLSYVWVRSGRSGR